MYHHPGEYVTDFCIVRHDGVYHLFHIRGERWAWLNGYRELDLGHATSTDLLNWTAHEPVLPVGPLGAWDESGIWAPDIVESDGLFYCFYTGSNTFNNQSIGLATSSDLFTWTKHPANPVVVPGPWSDCDMVRDVAGRDAMVFHDKLNGRYLLYYTATMADGRACIALAQSHDLVHWADRGPTYVEKDRSYNRLESAYVVEHDRRYYLFYSAKGGPNSKGFSPDDFIHFDIVYLISDSPTGGWTQPPNHELLTEWTCASEHPTFDGVTYMLYVVQEEIEGVWGASMLSDPKRMEWMPDGTVQIREHEPTSASSQTIFDCESDSYECWVQHHAEWQQDIAGELSVFTSGADAYFMDTLWGSDLAMSVETRSRPDAVASMMVRANPSAMAGYRVSLDFERGIVGLYLHMPGEPAETIQERSLEFQHGRWYEIKVVIQDCFIDVYVDGTLWIVRHHKTFMDGCYGLHARGDVRLRNLKVCSINQSYLKVNWQLRSRPRHLFP